MYRQHRTLNGVLRAAIGLLLCCAGSVWAQPTAFTYQGKLTDAGNPANGNYDLQFKLFDTPTVATGAQQGGTMVRNPTVASAGVFTVTLDFGASVFGGADRYLEIGVRPVGSASAYTVLAPRQPITSSPYAIQTINAQQLGGLPASRYLTSADNGNVGFGTSTPTSKVEIAAQDGLAITGYQPFLTLRDTNAEGKKGFMQSINGDVSLVTNGGQVLVLKDGTGKVGIGTTNPVSTLDIVTAQDGLSITGYQPFLTLRDTGGSNKRSFMQGINGDVVLVTNNGSGLVLKDTTGNVGLGTPTPAHRLDINGGPVWTSNGWAGAVSLSNAAAVAWQPNSAGNSFGIGQTNGGLYFFNSNSVPGNTASPANYLLSISDSGNLIQSRAGYGLPKAMIYVNSSGAINRCYSGVSNSSSGNCGFVTYLDGPSQVFRVNFGFPISDRFLSVTAHYGAGNRAPNNMGANFDFVDSTSVNVVTFDANGGEDPYAVGFMIILY